jgi:serine/threonine-protein kinase
MSVTIPRQFGRYTVERIVGRGGMGAVYLARQEELGRLVVVKVMTPDAVRDPTGAERLRREAKAAAQVSSENVVRVYESGVVDGVPFIAMEYVEGKSAQALLAERGKLPAGEATRLVLQAAMGLRDVHAAGILHRDVKPGNLLVGPAGVVKLADFGICKETGFSGGASLTQSGEVLGSPDYMAPEQAEGKALDARADLYALGVTYYELLAGTPPFRGNSGLATIARALSETARPLREVVPGMPGCVERACLGLMARNRGDRPADAVAAVALLTRVLDELAPAAPLARGRWARHVVVPAVLAAGIVAGTLAGLVVTQSGSASVARETEDPGVVARDDTAAPTSASNTREARPSRIDTAVPTAPETGVREAAARLRRSMKAAGESRAATAAKELAALREKPFVERSAAPFEAIARSFKGTPAASEARREADAILAFEETRVHLVARLRDLDVVKVGGALEPLQTLDAPPAIEKDVREVRLCFESTVLLVEQLAPKVGSEILHGKMASAAARVARDDPSGELDAALVLVALARKEPVPASASELGGIQAKPLAVALRLAKREDAIAVKGLGN